VLLNSYNVSKRQKDMGDNENRERENLLIRSFLYPRRNHAEPYSAEGNKTWLSSNLFHSLSELDQELDRLTIHSETASVLPWNKFFHPLKCCLSRLILRDFKLFFGISDANHNWKSWPNLHEDLHSSRGAKSSSAKELREFQDSRDQCDTILLWHLVSFATDHFKTERWSF